MIDLARTTELVKGALFDAEATWRSYLPEAGDWKKTALLLTVPLILASAVIASVLGLVGSNASLFGGLVFAIVWGAIAAAIVAYIFGAFASFFGGKGGFALGLAATTLAFVPGYVGRALSGLPWIGWLLGLALAIYSLVLLWRISPLYFEVPEGKRTMHYVASLIASIVVSIVLSAIFGAGLVGGGRDVGRVSGVDGVQPNAAGGGLFGGLTRQAEILAGAEEDRYEAPRDGELTERQVQEFARVMERTSEALGEREQRLREIAERADADQEVSLSDLTSMMSGMTEIAGLSTVEIEVVKSAGGNWAEHQWVKESLRTAWLQKDVNDTVAHNYALYRQYEDQLATYIAQ